MDLRALRYFVEIAKQRNFTAAAERCFVTQPTLSKRIAELEDELGQQLFIRSTRRVELTEKGLLLFHQAQTILGLVEQTERDMRDSRELTGDLNISAAEVPVFQTIAAVVERLQRRHPAVRVHLTSSSGLKAIADLQSGVAHFALLNLPTELAGLDSIELPGETRWGILTRTDGPFAGRKSIQPEDLLAPGAPKLFLSTQRLSEGALAGWLGAELSRLPSAGSYNLLNNMRYLVRAGYGCLALEGILPQDDAVMFLPLEPKLVTKSVLAWRAGSVRDAVAEAFIEDFRAEIHAQRTA